jgi:N-acetylglucosaminyl-diphospho-decaprenol L-rhamnosyltransferase
MSLVIVILNYRTPQVTLDCLASLAPCMDEVPGTRVLLVDNASGDDSIPRVRAAIETNHWTWCDLIENPTNDGFAGGNNRAIEKIKGDTTLYIKGRVPFNSRPPAKYVLFLNSDTIMNPGVLRHCVGVMDAEPNIGAMSCMLRNADGSIQNPARKFPTPLRQTVAILGLAWKFPKLFGWADVDDPGWDRAGPARDVEWLGGAFFLTRRDLLDRIGPMDESFFFYGEDIELSHRIMRAGYRRRYDPSIWITHLGGSSSDPTRVPAKSKSVYSWQSRYRIQKRCYGSFAAMWLRTVDVVAYALRCAKMKLSGSADQNDGQNPFDILALLTHHLTLPPPLQGEGRGEGAFELTDAQLRLTPPLPNPPPEGEGTRRPSREKSAAAVLPTGGR